MSPSVRFPPLLSPAFANPGTAVLHTSKYQLAVCAARRRRLVVLRAALATAIVIKE
ncbi:MAG: hypothetical protein MJE77_43095 [Proteobacteria bacterium]|nr:hypothetical protein [Pseudomonadota bacterium]